MVIKNVACLAIINMVIEKIISSLEAGDITEGDPLFNINSFFSKIDMEKEKMHHKYEFKQLAETVLTMSEKLPENHESKEFEINVSTLLNNLEI